jgi:hypothetical protein
MNKPAQDGFAEAQWLIPLGCITGLFGLVFGGFLLLYCYAFASMVPPSLSGAAWRERVFQRMFLNGDIGAGTYLALGIILLSLSLICVPWIGLWRRQKAAMVVRPQRSVPVIDDAVSRKWTGKQASPESIKSMDGISESPE